MELKLPRSDINASNVSNENNHSLLNTIAEESKVEEKEDEEFGNRRHALTKSSNKSANFEQAQEYMPPKNKLNEDRENLKRSHKSLANNEFSHEPEDINEKREKNLKYAFQHMVSDMGISNDSNTSKPSAIDESENSKVSQSQSF
eukprot:CAMPEP_0205823702 /NCGR_PEP_ID=MMETSP0206-20130828/17742_1 /ASSEMBLY_ACC=CAM_ASM_000279 /TAXON_ID=36767 /ORGANISM="Euplotes focardii, Strain TN1" /LENGTH=144 /DNA_ID=CAMNT_0053121127 /DNA_START=760 /DNA_END=1191 /DNA_ORIENTATION=+